MTFLFSDTLFFLLLASLATWAPAPPLPAAWLLGFLLVLSLFPRMRRPLDPGRLRLDFSLALVCLFLLWLSVPFPPAVGTWGWWPAAAAFLLLLGGWLSCLRDRERPWSEKRREMALAAAALLVLSALVAGLLRGLLAFRTSGIVAGGSVDFLFYLPVVLAAWFGLDAHLRSVRDLESPSPAAWLFNRRHTLGLVLASAIILLRSGFS